MPLGNQRARRRSDAAPGAQFGLGNLRWRLRYSSRSCSSAALRRAAASTHAKGTAGREPYPRRYVIPPAETAAPPGPRTAPRRRCCARISLALFIPEHPRALPSAQWPSDAYVGASPARPFAPRSQLDREPRPLVCRPRPAPVRSLNCRQHLRPAGKVPSGHP